MQKKTFTKFSNHLWFSSVQSLSRIQLFEIPWTTALQAFLSNAEKNFYKIQQPFMIQFSSVAQSYPTLWDTMNYSTPGLPVHHQLLEFTQTYDQESVIPSNHLILSCPLLLLPSIFPSITVFSNDSAFSIRWPSIRVSASASVLSMNIQNWFPLGWLFGSPCSTRDSHESSPTPQFKNIRFLALSFLYSPTLTSTLDYRKNHSFD